MAKKASFNLLYLIGMACIVVGFCLPMFAMGGGWFADLTKTNGFSYITSKGGFVTCGALFIFIGGVLGLVECFIALGPQKMMKMLAIIISIAGGIILVIGFNQNIMYKTIARGFLKCARVGFYTILAGWVLSIVGYLSEK
ncbi:hypothetical protein [Treponema sp.]|uniref:hypothetical protein n=1 Tax=Treponema sp. TaxID=166 RepID=UPI00298DF02B|nr:hypothetical protein [Treponema sp.]MCR5612292.1 hypothetical protein [Treponema sp.]